MNINTKYKIIIPATILHREVVRESIPRLKLIFPKVEIELVTPNPSDFNNIGFYHDKILSDIEYVDFCIDDIRNRLPEEKWVRSAWYYQQLLKYKCIEKSDSEYVLIMDADTVILNFPSGPYNGIDCFFASREWHQPYFEVFNALMGFSAVLKHSAIVNFMWFSVKELKQLLQNIELRFNMCWVDAILNVAGGHQSLGSFSEYETYANWIAKRSGITDMVSLKMFRRADMLLSMKNNIKTICDDAALKGYDVITFENYHTSNVQKKVLARVAFTLSISV